MFTTQLNGRYRNALHIPSPYPQTPTQHPTPNLSPVNKSKLKRYQLTVLLTLEYTLRVAYSMDLNKIGHISTVTVFYRAVPLSCALIIQSFYLGSYDLCMSP